MNSLSRYFIKNVLSYGMIASLLIIIVRAAVYLFNVSPTNVSFSLINFMYNLIVVSICLYLGTITYRKKTMSGNLTYGEGLLSCIGIGFVSVFLIYVYDIIFHVFIDPGYLISMFEPQLAAISSNSSIPPMQRLELMEKLEKWASPVFYVSMNALMSFGISIVIALITAIFTVRKRPIVIENFEETN